MCADIPGKQVIRFCMRDDGLRCLILSILSLQAYWKITKSNVHTTIT